MQRKKESKSQSKPKKSDDLKKSAEKMEMVFSEGHELFTKLISVIPDVVVLTDMNGKIIFINDIGVQLAGYSRAKKLIGKDALSLIVPQQKNKARRDFTRIQREMVGPKEYILLDIRGGSSIPFELKGNILKNTDGSPFASVFVCRDITERKKAEEALMKSEQRYRAILDKAPDVVLIRDINGNIVDANIEATKLFGYSKKELIGQPISKQYPPEELERAQKAFGSVRHRGKARVDNINVLRKNGQKVNTDVSGSCFSFGNEILYKIVFRDMTEQRKLQEQLKRAKTELEATIVQRTMELMQANTALKVLLNHQNQEKIENEEKLSMNLHNEIMPYIQELKKELPREKKQACIQMIEKNLQNVMSEFLTHLHSTASKLTPKEIQVASLIKEGMSTKEIARFLNVSRKTVDIFRYNIRKKLGLNRKESLMSHLLSL
ncbi:MAG: PAS domain S-box protein [Syntrophales bacterium]|jgi:PAS domain S-box-containing protein